MLQTHSEYLVIDEAFEVPIGRSLIGHAPNPDTPWPKPGEVVELHPPAGTPGSNTQVLILKIDDSMDHIPAARIVLISPNAPQSSSLQGFRVTHCHNPSSAMLQQQRDYQSAQARQTLTGPISLLVTLIAILAATAVLYCLH